MHQSEQGISTIARTTQYVVQYQTQFGQGVWFQPSIWDSPDMADSEADHLASRDSQIVATRVIEEVIKRTIVSTKTYQR